MKKTVNNELNFKTPVMCGQYSDKKCVAVAIDGDNVVVRDTKNPTQGDLIFTRDEWNVFVKGVKKNEFDIE